MVIEVRDTTGRFAKRPFYKAKELDGLFETLIGKFLTEVHGRIEFPIVTDDLTKLIERHTTDFDSYADLTEFGTEVEGVTEFRRGRKPAVRIAARLAEDERYENRLRTTLAHEFGHVHLHAYLWEFATLTGGQLTSQPHADKQICKRETIVGARESDWMEWQAGYASGALLMPASAVRRVVLPYAEQHGLYGSIQTRSLPGGDVIRLVMDRFQVSQEAARVRLEQLAVLTAAPDTPSLFS